MKIFEEIMEALYRTIHQRRRPEDVAQMILEMLDDALTPNERRILDCACPWQKLRLEPPGINS